MSTPNQPDGCQPKHKRPPQTLTGRTFAENIKNLLNQNPTLRYICSDRCDECRTTLWHGVCIAVASLMPILYYPLGELHTFLCN